MEGPVDLGLKYKGKRIFGDNKTIRGIVLGSLLATLLGFLLFGFYEINPNLGHLSNLEIFSFCFIMSLLSLSGDLLGSFLKRQLNITPGDSLLLVDQIDWIVFPLIYYYILFGPQDLIWATIFLAPICHLSIKLIAYYLRIEKKAI